MRGKGSMQLGVNLDDPQIAHSVYLGYLIGLKVAFQDIKPKYDRNLGKRCRRSEGKNLEKNEGEKGVYNLVVSSDNLGAVAISCCPATQTYPKYRE
ncbi:hypothetical protein Pyn_04155 [Prunus yedoensis var. nudiflora]|uniref:Uncharacterized protein n=1 Tax=Prunus yedoensis var. nudiflora TaxID=2094558 RepID=A0A314UQV0_PRUYE|nr:hypothetical protein Pyn_04155 [Prunus yedoensis var. nudiflora]